MRLSAGLLAAGMVALLVAVSCGRQTATSPAPPGDTIRMKYAGHLLMVRHAGYTEVRLSDPWNAGRTLHTYILVPRTAKVPSNLPQGTLVRTPLLRAVVGTSPHCWLAARLGAGEAIAGVFDSQYINLPYIKSRLAKRAVADCGSSLAPAVERVAELQADAVFVSPFRDSGGYGKLESTGIALIETADYMETSAMGRAEWMRFYGMLLGRAAEADSLFCAVDSAYSALRRHASRLPRGLSVLTERKTGGVWYCPGGRSSMAKIFAHAHAPYAFAADSHSGSLALPFEEVLSRAGEAQVWAFKYEGNRQPTRRDLLREFHGYAALRAFRSGSIYGCPSSASLYFEETSFRPDLLLREFIIMLHPDAGIGSLRYYRKIED